VSREFVYYTGDKSTSPLKYIFPLFRRIRGHLNLSTEHSNITPIYRFFFFFLLSLRSFVVVASRRPRAPVTLISLGIVKCLGASVQYNYKVLQRGALRTGTPLSFFLAKSAPLVRARISHAYTDRFIRTHMYIIMYINLVTLKIYYCLSMKM